MSPSFKVLQNAFGAIECRDWAEFRSKLDYFTLGDRSVFGRFLFRGQSNIDWGLVSSFDFLHMHLTQAERDIIFNRMIEDFRKGFTSFEMNRRVEWSFPQGTPPSDGYYLEALAQHYGNV